MQKIATPNNIENRPLSPEEIEALERFREEQKRLEQQKNADELLAAVQGPEVKPGIPFNPDHPDDKLAQETAKILPFKSKDEKIIDETGLGAAEAEILHRDPLEWVNSAISRKDLDPNDAMLGLIEASEREERDEEKKAA